ncbi:MAG: ABC-F family ATP-binding cassette domain-containing protein [Acidobacteria bacterium]|nr:ABC-F family ATP-binding cassette domain-containing protein [Acidobacteriota bacterium]
MNILSLENVSKNFGIKPLFDNVTIGFEDSDKIGIIGANGSGKTTLLRVIAGTETTDSGRVVRANDISVSFLSQNPEFNEEATVLETVFEASDGVMKLIRDYEAVCEELTREYSEETLEKMSELQHELESTGGWEIETNAKNVLTRLGILDMSAKMKTLSGGQRKRVAMAHGLIIKPDILIMDEPTNHLDADTIKWLEDYLRNYKGALLLVTHDRYFLDRVTNRIFEIDRGTVQVFRGNYAYYLEKKDEQETLIAVEGHKREQRIKKELAWLRSGTKARTTKSKARINSAHELMARPKDRVKDEIDIAIGSKRLGSKIIEIESISKSYGDQKLIDDFSYLVKRDDRIGIIGENGSGKTTLLEIITDRIKPDSGNIEIGETVHIGYYDQESRALDEEQRVIDYIKEVAEYVTTADGTQITASQMLRKFLFPPEAQYSFIRNLSGGERRRLYLLRILMGAPNILFMDEPTNDLDIQTLIALEEYLDDFPGALIVVSHDRYFLDRTVDNIFRFEGEGEINEYPGNYSAYLERKEAKEAEERAQKEKAADGGVSRQGGKPSDQAPKKLSYKENEEFKELELKITETENRISEIDGQLEEFASDSYSVNELYAEKEVLEGKLENDIERWSSLAERAGLE